jgi:hypothetical protein
LNRSTQSLILNVIFPSLFLGMIAGAFVGYFMGKSTPVSMASKLIPEKTNDSPKIASGKKATEEDAFPKAPSVASAASTNGTTLQPGTYPTPAAETITQLGEKSWIQGEVQSKTQDEKTGNTQTTEALPEGATANREYRPDGTLKGESIVKADGTNISRNFFENGNVKIAYVKEPNGAETSVLYDSTGFITQHTTVYPDQTRIYSEYDDHGTAIRTWRAFPDGHTEPYPATSENEE